MFIWATALRSTVCVLTVIRWEKIISVADIMHETLDRSSLGALGVKSPVNLEQAMLAERMVWRTYRLRSHRRNRNHQDECARTEMPRLVYDSGPRTDSAADCGKGSIAIDGISLTVARVDHVSFSVSIIPHTLQETALAFKRAGDIVNLENDCIGRVCGEADGSGRRG